jgi:uncharacterized repeat protein (TIGR03803 family)
VKSHHLVWFWCLIIAAIPLVGFGQSIQPIYYFTSGLTNPLGRLALGPDGYFYGTTVSGGIGGYGTVFKVTTNGNLTTLVNFGNTNGANPTAGLSLGPDGNFYGTTEYGGNNGDFGTVFSVSTNGALNTLFNFSNTNGAYPYMDLTLGPGGDFYGATPYGGDGGWGTVFRVATNGILTTLFSFSNTNGAFPFGSLTLGSDGNFYGTTRMGGSNGYDAGILFKITTNGILTTLVNFDITNGAQPFLGLTLGIDGNFYGTTLIGGDYGSGTIFKMAKNGILTKLHSFSAVTSNGNVDTNTDGANPAASLTLGADGNFYGTTLSGGINGCGTLFKLTTNGTFVTLDNFNITNGTAPQASLTLGSDGNLYGVTSQGGSSGGGVIYRVTLPPVLSRAATGTASVTNGFCVGVNIVDGGYGYTNTPLVRIVGGGGSGAQAFAVVSNGVVTGIIVTNAGFGYTSAPVVVIEPPFILNPLLGIAPMSFLAFSNLTMGGSYQLQRAAAWYWTNQPVSFTATDVLYTQMVAGVAGSGAYRLALNPAPTQAFATPEVVNGFVVGATVTSGGSGYVTSPAVSIKGGGGTNATALAQISGGVVTNIFMTNAGFGYTNTPSIRISQPPAAAVSPTVLPVMRVDSASLAPYDNYQIQFKPDLGEAWVNWAGGMFSPTDVTNSQFLFITNDVGFFRLLFVP